jgi:long-chain acyl-CoA synthetase
MTAVYQGGEIILKTFPVASQLLEAITEHEITSFAAVPAIYIEMVSEYEQNPDKYDVSSIESLSSGAAPLAEDTRERIEEVFDTPLVEGWGMTETSPAGTAQSSRGVHKGAGCVGQPLPDLELKLVDPETRETRVSAEFLDPSRPVDTSEVDFDDEESVTGEIAVRGPQIFKGYYKMPEKTAEVFDDEGWFYTDDIARVDEDRYLWMVDRADDMMLVGGENVYPAEIENELYSHPEIQEVAVVAAPHKVKGEAPVAFVVPEHDADPTEREIREFALERVPTYAHPRKVFFVDELPRSGTRKVQRYKLEDEVEEKIEGALESSEEI